ncbi:hypothetical protein Lal_00026381 [Lupinus albus]|uniref:Putative RNA recognition motif domain-containing protein n=1 Tax=Lupinus albus TaxID=3870 RepID=A0A6A4PYX8_LUPAL|nr:putative RNA recognition motif domain-containing protein [Lupinus albus]KAF1861902.1 hypothetical protein Lal_00026381 [Lupinus albus]
MDDMAAYYSQQQHQPLSYQYYQHPPPPPPTAMMTVVPPPPGAPDTVSHHLHQQYLPQPHYYPQQPMFSSYSPHIPSHQLSPDEVRTLFIAGLPEDVKPREIYNLFREFPGYESSHLRSRSNSSQAFAFAVFINQHSAIMAMQALNGMVFDLEKKSTLYIDLAKSNSRSKRTRIDDARAGSDKKAKGSAPSWASPDSGVGNIHMPGLGNPTFNTNTIGYPSAQRHSHVNAGANAVNDGLFSNLKKCSTPYIPQNSTPCATLFVANLGPSFNEQELIQLFSRCPGYLKLKMQSTYGAPVAFIDFQDVATSTNALNSLQGTILHSSSLGEGMRLEYAKSRMGLRKKPK